MGVHALVGLFLLLGFRLGAGGGPPRARVKRREGGLGHKQVSTSPRTPLII